MIDPYAGVTLAELRESLAWEEATGHGPGSPGRLAQAEAERRELARLEAHWAANPRWAPPEYRKRRRA